MVPWQGRAKCPRELHSLLRRGPERRPDPIRDKGWYSAGRSPRVPEFGVGEKALQHEFVIAHQANRFGRSHARHQDLNHGSRIVTAVDVISEQDCDAAASRITPYVEIDGCQHLTQQVRAPMDVTDRIEANPWSRPESRLPPLVPSP